MRLSCLLVACLQADLAAHPTAAPPGTAATAKRKPIDRLPGLRPKLNLKPTEPFYGGTPAAPSALLDIGGSRPARQPTRGKGKQQPPGDEDGDWYPDERALQQQQQDADADDDSDFDWQHAPRRRPRPRQRTQAANVGGPGCRARCSLPLHFKLRAGCGAHGAACQQPPPSMALLCAAGGASYDDN